MGKTHSLLAGALLLALLALLPQPQPEARLFSGDWGAASFIDPSSCLTPAEGQSPRFALFPKMPAVAGVLDRFSLAVRYLAWGLLLPALALAAVFHPQGGARHPALLIFGALGLAPAWFQWTLNPAFVALRQSLAEAWIARWPLDEGQFAWLDGLALALWLAGGILLAGGACFAATRLAARLGGIDWRRLARALRPLAAAILLLGLTQATALFLRGEGANLDWLPGLRGALLALAVVASGWLGLRALKVSPGGTASKAAAALLWLVPLALSAAHGWAMYFHWSGRYHA